MLAALFLSLLPVLKATTSFGFSDHDAMDYLFISSTMFFFVKAMKKEEPAPPASAPSFKLGEGGWAGLPREEQTGVEKPAKQHLIYYALAGLSIGLFALSWEGFPMLAVLLSGFMLLCALLNSRMKLLDMDMLVGFLLLSVVSTGIASLWYGFGILPILAIELASAAFSYVAIRFENSGRNTLVLVALVICSLPLMYLFRGNLIDIGVTYLALNERGVYLEYIAELKAPSLSQFSQLYGVQLLPFVLGLGLFINSLRRLRRETVFFMVSVAFFIFLSSTALRFVQYLGIFVSILSAYFLNKVSETLNDSVKKDVFIPVMLISAVVLTQSIMPFLPNMTFAISEDWHASLQWLKNNSHDSDVVMSWWDYSPWVNGVAERKTVVNNQPPGRFDDSMIFFGTNDWGRAKAILEKYNVSYVVVSRGTLTKIYLAGKFLNESIDFQASQPLTVTPPYYVRFGGAFKTYFDPMSKVAWDEYSDGRKLYYGEVGLFDDQSYKTKYFKTNLTGAEFNEDYLFLFSNMFIRIPKESNNRVFFNLIYENSTIPYLRLVNETGEVRIYKVLR